jgi:hypothetical protein
MAISYNSAEDINQAYVRHGGATTGNTSNVGIGDNQMLHKDGNHPLVGADSEVGDVKSRDSDNKLGDNAMQQKWKGQQTYSWETIVAPSGRRIDGTLVNGNHQTAVTYTADTAAQETRSAPGDFFTRRAKTVTSDTYEAKTG